MVPIEPFLAHQHAAAEREKARRREEEEVMTGYRPDELGQWQFKIVKGTYKTAPQIEAVVQEQAEFGWTLVEIFDHSRMRFKRPASEAAKDAYREGNPYATVSKASGPGCTSLLLLLVGLVGFGWYWLA